MIGHEALLRELRALATAPEPPHALLFAGPESVGRERLALAFAMMLNCERRQAPAGASLFGDEPAPTVDLPCGECRPCRLIAEGAHPDVVTVEPGDSLCRPRPGDSGHEAHPLSRDIRICQVRGIIDLASRYPFEAATRLIVIKPAERLREEASNALLKTLEEPPGHTVFVLISAAPEAIIETILSRCRRVDVGTVPRREIVEGLVTRGVTQAAAEAAAEASRGRPGVALALARDPGRAEDRQRLFGLFERLVSGRLDGRFRYVAQLVDRWHRDRNDVLGELGTWEAFWESRLREQAAALAPAADVRETVDALAVVAQARNDLLANVQARIALHLMLVAFPRRTLQEAVQARPEVS